MPRISTLAASYPTDCETLLHVRNKYTQHLYFLNRGYIAYQVCLPSRYYEHRLVADIVFGGIPNGYHVHHINEITTDNQADNLQLLSPSEHAGLHNPPRGQMLACPICATPFWATKSRQDRRDANYCSPQCVALSQRVADRPGRDELGQTLTRLPNFAAIGRMYGVDGNAIRKWCRGYDLPAEVGYWRKLGASDGARSRKPPDPQSGALPIELQTP